jgi:2-oxoglutarate dehydrogenase complex dehydrogenase (E1) component-like enzyme
VVIDVIGYRRHGHNEGDEPAFTQPVMYRHIRERSTLAEVYTEQLILRGDLTVAQTEAIAKKFQAKAAIGPGGSKDRAAASDRHARLRRPLARTHAALFRHSGRDRRVL